MKAPQAITELVASRRLSLPLLVQAGSKAYGLDVKDSDDDYVGVFVPRLREFVSLPGLERDTYTGNKPDFTLHEIGKFCHLALKGNPAILETLWNPMILHQDEWGRRLIALRGDVLHRESLKVYVSYAESQMKKMVKGKRLHSKGGTYNEKYGAHLIRLLHAGISLSESSEVVVRVPEGLAATLMEIRLGQKTMEDVLKMARPLLERLKGLSDRSSFPERPNHEAINALVTEARLSRE